MKAGLRLFYYRSEEKILCSPRNNLPFTVHDAPPGKADILYYLFERKPDGCRTAFAVSNPAQLSASEEGVSWLNQAMMNSDLCDPVLSGMIEERRVRAVNLSHPRWRKAADLVLTNRKKRVNILAIGDVGSMLLTGLRLLGGDVISSIGICDIDEKTAARWELEINQIAYPWDYHALPEVEVISPDALFDGDVFVFCASKGIPAVGSDVKDVRMAQYEANATIIARYARMAREKQFGGLFAVVSDPVDPLCKAALLASNENEAGVFDGNGLFPEQIQGYGLGVMNARAAYFAKRDGRFASFLTEGRSYGPHGENLVIANSIDHYDDALSRELTDLAVTANIKVRALGYKPYIAPAFSSGAISLLLTLRGEWHCSSTFLGGVFMGAKNRNAPAGLEVEALDLPDALYQRIVLAAEQLSAIV